MGKGTLGGKSGRLGEVGLSGAPPEHERVGAGVDQQEHQQSSQAREPVSSRAHEDRPVQYTLRLSYDESDDLDSVARALRKRRGKATANADVLRGLVALAKSDPDLQERLAKELPGESS